MGLREWWADYQEATPGMPVALRIGLVVVVVIAVALLVAHIIF